MRKLVFTIVIMLLLFSISAIYGNKEQNSASKVIFSGQVLREPIVGKKLMPIDKAILSSFFKKYPYLKECYIQLIRWIL